MSDIDLNHIQEARSVPEFVEIFERKLASRPDLPPDVISPYKYRSWFHDPESQDADRDDSIPQAQDITPESHEREQPRRAAEAIEALHIAILMEVKWECFWTGLFGKALKGPLADGIFFNIILGNVLSLPPTNMLTAQLYVLCCLPLPIAI